MKRNKNPHKSKISHFSSLNKLEDIYTIPLNECYEKVLVDKNPFLSLEDQLEQDEELTRQDEKREELLDSVYEAMRKLTPRQKDVIRMCILEEQSFLQVSKQLKVHSTSVQHCLNGQSAIYKGKRAHTGGALRKLRRLLETSPI